MLASCGWDPWGGSSDDSSDDNSYENSDDNSDDNSYDDSDDSDDILRPRQHAQTIDIPQGKGMLAIVGIMLMESLG